MAEPLLRLSIPSEPVTSGAAAPLRLDASARTSVGAETNTIRTSLSSASSALAADWTRIAEPMQAFAGAITNILHSSPGFNQFVELSERTFNMPRQPSARSQSARRTRAALIPIPQPPAARSLTFNQWSEYGRELLRFGRELRTQTKNYQLVCGRWFAAGEAYGRARERYATQLGFALGTLYNWSSVAARIPRQLDALDLTFEDYRILATLPTDAERITWARRKLAEGWSGRELAARVLDARAAPEPSTPPSNGAHHDETAPGTDSHRAVNSTVSAPRGDAPATGRAGRLSALIADWTHAAEQLQARGDAALADAYLDCAAQLQETLGG